MAPPAQPGQQPTTPPVAHEPKAPETPETPTEEPDGDDDETPAFGPGGGEGKGNLPFTGSESLVLLTSGLAMIGAGGAVVFLARRRTRDQA